MKNIFFLLFCVCSLQLSAQKIDGFYSGVLHNDSAKMIQQYELAIAMYKGKITGYSYVTFIVNDTFYYGIRKVKGEIIGDSMVIEDDKMVSNNFPESPAKKIGRTITIPLNGQDSLVTLSGSWKTNQRKYYYSVPGTIEMNRSTDSLNSPLINHLKELKIISTPNYAATTNDVAKTKTVKKEVTEIKTKPAEKETEVVKTKAKTKEKKPKETEIKEKENKTDVIQTSESKTKIKTESKTEVVKTEIIKLTYDQRNTKLLHTIEVGADSLILSFYDNGVVDGDSISVYVNGENIISNVRLTTTAKKKTIMVSNAADIKLLLVAENLGSIPPNTGLLTIKDGEKIYQVHFSADLQTNASIIIRRKKN